MPFSSVLGASSVIKPGVCTSTTRPSVPYTGQLIFETDTSRLAVWTGSAWQYETAAAGPPGLVYITGASFTTVTSISLPNNTFTSTYRNYRLVFQVTGYSTDATLSLRMRAGGADDSTASYIGAFLGVDRNADTTRYLRTNNATSLSLGTTKSVVLTAITFDVVSPQLTAKTHLLGNIYNTDASGFQAAYNGSGTFDLSTSFDALSIIVASGTMTGIYRVYGYTDS